MNLKLNKKIKLGSKVIDHNSKPYLIGEVSCNHNGEIANAKKLILTAKKFGADAVKFQTYTPDTITLKSDGSLIASSSVNLHNEIINIINN